MADAKLARKVSMSFSTDLICFSGAGTAAAGGDGSGDGYTNGGSNGEAGLDLLRDKDGKSDSDGEDDDGKGGSVGEDDDGISIDLWLLVVSGKLMSRQSEYRVTQQSRSDPRLMSLCQSLVGSDMMTNETSTPARSVVAGKGVGR
nr:hypothetical protein [Tanacetum cinerariifolium]